ncbi:hypothetical protein PI125_g23463 [Phytophthora idaei]|nr:hypothetical protein PI125_g23463 [Phytophthora idaei]KAG3128201.1 hypothetical protein PI126_g21502 [Phytophthora idaei]
MAHNQSPNPRPRQQRRRREDDTAADAASAPQNNTGAVDDGVPDTEAPHSTQQSTVDTMAMMRQMFEFMSTAQRQNQEQMAQMLQQQVLLQQQMLQAHVAAQKPQKKKKGNPPTFNGQASDDLELCRLSTEQYYSNYAEEMQSDSSDFVNTIVANRGPTVRPLPEQLQYQDEDAVSPTRREKIYGYLSQGGRIEDVSVSIFIDSGALFNAISPAGAESLKLQVTTLPDPLRVKLGGGQRVSIPRRTTSITVSMEGFPDYATEVSVMEIPEGKNVMLVFP